MFCQLYQGAKSGGEMESAQAKNQALMDAGAIVPTSYESFETSIKETFAKLVLYMFFFLTLFRAIFVNFHLFNSCLVLWIFVP